MRDIATEAGVALSQLNYYFKSKEGLYSAVMSKAMDRYLNTLRSILNAGIDMELELEQLERCFTDSHAEHPELGRLFLDFSAQSMWVESFSEQIIAFNTDLDRIMCDFIRGFRTATSGQPNAQDALMAQLISNAMVGMSIRRVFLGESACAGPGIISELLKLSSELSADKSK